MWGEICPARQSADLWKRTNDIFWQKTIDFSKVFQIVFCGMGKKYFLALTQMEKPKRKFGKYCGFLIKVV